MRRATFLAAGLAVLLAGCGSGGTDKTTATTPSTATRSPASVPRSLPAGYGGLGATRAAFAARNNMTRPASPTAGIPVYTIDATNSAGRVTAYTVELPTRPPMSNQQRLFLTEGTSLPDDIKNVRESSTCQVWESATLKRLLGTPYARSSTVTGTDSASIESVPRPRC